MQLPVRSLLLMGIFLLFLSAKAGAQKIYIDSLEKILVQTSLPREDKVIILCKLARANFEKNLPLSFKQANEALYIGAGMHDGRGKALAFATLIHLYIRQKDIRQAYISGDIAL
jgi:hypothetical protein